MEAGTDISDPTQRKFRLLTRCDFDGLVSAVLLKELDLIDEVRFVHPKEMQDRRIDVGSNDITTNLPFCEGVHLAFDHHSSEVQRVGDENFDCFIDAEAPSASRVVYDHFGGADAFPRVSQALMDAVDKCDSANFTINEILVPSGWVLLNFLVDPRTELGRFGKFKLTNEQLMLALVDYCREHTIGEILKLPDIRERIEIYIKHAEPYQEQVKRRGTVHENVVVLDLRDEELLYCGNRFVIYALFAKQNISIHVVWGKNRQNTVLAVGKSTVRRDCKLDVGKLMLEYGGGGHKNVGTCQIDNAKADDVLKEIIGRITAVG